MSEQQPVRVQLALDRMTIQEAITMAKQVEQHVDWIEVGTSLIKEFGIESVRQMKQAFPHKIIVADIKTFDNAKYEFELCFEAGADVATVMGAAPDATLELCMQTAHRYQGQTMIDLLSVSPDRIQDLERYTDAVLCHHVSKDEQEHNGQKVGQSNRHEAHATSNANHATPQIAVAGGITLTTLPKILQQSPSVIIVGSAITQAAQPQQAAQQIREQINQFAIQNVNPLASL
ncbi:orotidine 5'-phosphate decarboxylase [Paenibacillus sp. PsM32]|uniref:3-hexulose-6-phosphate synthase n=1 Tax=Paenibacillus sp. PsM32 TaxID=3030536 RepID=UPI00263A5D41|nr:3-hexulose-6-phosphate synthase [Paenibacillus sp. PsM32]MDN4617607.1 orotidine 5'-phosphate decarboxylase [Paenibacillus sp. PsM32]